MTDWLSFSYYRNIFFNKEVPEEEAEAQLNKHEEELFRHPVPVDMSVKGVSAVQIMVKLVRMLVNLYQNGGVKGAQAWDFRLRFFCFKRTQLVPWYIT